MNDFRKTLRKILSWVLEKRVITFFSWNRIASIGNNPYAKMSIIAPIVAPLALYTDNLAEWVEYYFDFSIAPDGLPWLYVCLLFLSAGQLCYAWFAPSIFKEFASRTDYANRGVAGKEFRDWNALAALLASDALRDSTIIFNPVTDELRNSLPKIDLKRAGFLKGMMYWEQNKRLSPEFLEHYEHGFTQYKAIIFEKVPEKALKAVVRLVRLSATNNRDFHKVSESRAELLRLEYDRENSTHPVKRIVICLFYGIGLSWFVVNVPRGICDNLYRLFFS